MLCFAFVMNGLVAQTPFYQDIFKGGVSVETVGNNFAGYEENLYYNNVIPNDAEIKKAFLFVSQDDTSSLLSFYFNNNLFNLSESSKISYGFVSFGEGSNSLQNSSIHCFDVTNYLQGNQGANVVKLNSFNSTITNSLYSSFTLYIQFVSNNYEKLSTSIFIESKDVSEIALFSLSNINPINNFFPISFSSVAAYICDTINDGSYVCVNNDTIGLIGGTDSNTLNYCSGVYGCFKHYNNTSFGVGDDNSDSLVSGTDALANIQSYLNYGDTSIDVSFLYDSSNASIYSPFTNPIRYLFFAHSTKCDTLHSRVNISDTTICEGESLALVVGGDSTYTYAWRYRGEVISTDTSLNIAPQHNHLYSILVSDTNGCSKTEIINIKVNPTPQSYYSMIDAVCPQENGVIVIDSVQGQAPPYVYRKANGSWQTAPVYANLPQGEYIIQTQDTNQCITTDTLAINSINNTLANFTVPTNIPYLPTTLDFYNTSEHATEYLWYINNSLVTNTTDLSFYFSQSGGYTISLVASQNNEQCSDTLLKTIDLSEEQYLHIPSLWQVGSALQSYSFGYKSLTLHLLNNLGQVIAVEEYNLNNGTTELLNHRQLSRGVYYYHLQAKDNDGAIHNQSGKLIRM